MSHMKTYKPKDSDAYEFILMQNMNSTKINILIKLDESGGKNLGYERCPYLITFNQRR